MSGTSGRLRAFFITILATSVTAVGLVMTTAAPASAAPAPVLPRPASAVTADRLPTAQIDGVVWSQAVVGNTVYAGGKFNNARPAGAAAGTNLTARANLLAYDITTGNLITSFAPTLNAQVLSVAASPDGSRVYVVGDFTTANGQARRRVAAYSTATGQLVTSFNPVGVDAQARSVTATNDTVYVGGGFGSAGGTVRGNMAAFRASDGLLLPWDPKADFSVYALVQRNGSIYAGGSFRNVGGQPAYGLAKISAIGTGELDTAWVPSVRNAGPDAGIWSLQITGNYLYGSTWHYGPGGNLEGTFKVGLTNSDVEWVTDCHGDNYASFTSNGVVYTASHSHYCGNMGGGFPQYTTANGNSAWRFQHAQAWTDTAGGEILNEVHGYPNWHGVEDGPSLIGWNPDMAIGSYTGAYQAGWTVTGNNDYVVYGGEFPRVNGVGQQGLVRFARKPIAPGLEGPKFPSGSLAPTLVPTSTSSLRVSWPAGYDRDDYTLTYKVIRSGVTAPRYTTNANAAWWNLPTLGFVDTGLTPGAQYKYRIVANDPDGNIVTGSTISVTMPTTFAPANAYAQSVRANGARIYWPMNETSGTTITDRAAANNSAPSLGVTEGTFNASPTWGLSGAITGDSAAALGSTRAYSGGTESAPDTFTSQAWIKTSTTSGGRILGFSDLQIGTSGHRDRHVYMDNGGHLVFGVRAQNANLRTVSSNRSYNDNNWHQVTATMSPSGMALYVDGVRVGQRADTTQGETYLGYWRLSGDNLSGWPSQPNASNFDGSIDEVAIYPTALNQSQIDAQYEASGRTSGVPPAPADALGAAVYADDPDLFWRLGESSGTKAADSGVSFNDGTYRNGPNLGADGVISQNTAATFDGNDDFVSSDGSVSNPTIYTEEAWFKTTTTRGGKIIGFGSSQTGNSNSYDRHVYMQDDGHLVFGTYTGQLNTVITPASYNNGEWHHVVASQSGNGMKLYVDGAQVGSNPQTEAQGYTGYWKVGGDKTWGSSSAYFDGTIDEVAIYSSELSATRVAVHYAAAHPATNQKPTAAFTSTKNNLEVTADGSDSTDTDGTIVNYAWDFGDTWTTNGATPTATHTYSTAGAHIITLTVTDDDGATDTVSKTVTVSAANQAPMARFTTTMNRLKLNADASTSTDPDGTIASYAWDFGDQTTGTGKTPTHTYTAAGAYTVTLTVTDNDGGTDTMTRDVTASAPNADPVAAFSSSTTNLKVDVDAAASSDSDGTIVTYAWDFGDSTPIESGKTQSHTYAAAGSYTIKLTVTDNDGATNTVTHDVTVAAANTSPIAAFTTSTTNLKVNVNGGGSSDPDGSIASYGWDYGDGGTGSGVTDSHTYTTAGDHVITLTVTDNQGATSTLAKTVTVTAPPVNQAPTARFSSTMNQLTASLDASSSTDADGTIAGYSWNFGDNTAGTGVTTSHVYGADGPYTVTLTVTDNKGETDTVSHIVTVAAPAVIAQDDFDGRTVTNGWGTATTGGAWTVSGTASNYSVMNGSGSIEMSAGSGPSAYLNAISAKDVDLTGTVSFDKALTGGGVYTSLVGRRVGNSDYRAKVRVTATGTTLFLIRTVNGTETTLSSQAVSGMTVSANEKVSIRLQVSGSGPATLRAKVWESSSAEPSAWRLTSTDSTAALQNEGSVGIYTYLSGSASNAPVSAAVDKFKVVPLN